MTREYYDNNDLRIMVTDNYEDIEGWHIHDHTDQIIHVIRGAIYLHTSKDKVKLIRDGEFATIPAGVEHWVVPFTINTKMLVIKYQSTGENIIDDIKSDYIKIY
jgi:mannose-6-phosphate isomerase-like protein (cupin superfamily)